MLFHGLFCACGLHRTQTFSAVQTPDVPTNLTRRKLVGGVAVGGLLAGLASGATLTNSATAQPARQGRILIKGGTVVTVDPAINDLARGDVLIEGQRIAAVGQNLSADGADVIEASDMIVMPGFVDSHRHMWEGVIRNLIPNGTLPDYLGTVLGKYGTTYRPEDVYIGNLVSALSALDAGVTTIADWSHIQNSPAHTDEAIRALQEAGVRSMFAYGYPLGKRWWQDSTVHQYPQDIQRLRKQYFSTDDQLLTLGLAATGGYGNLEVAAREWKAARDVGARVTVHAFGKDQLVNFSKAFKLGSDTTYIHCVGFGADDWKLMADTGGTFSTSPGTEMLMDMGDPPIQAALNAGVRPSLSIDAETNVPTTMFAQIQLCLASQRNVLTLQKQRGEKSLPPRISARDALEFATIAGAKACGLDSKTGSLTPGKQADIVLLRKNHINVLPVNDPIAAITLGMDSSNVDTVFVAGAARKRNGQLVGVDLKRIGELANQSRDYLAGKAKG